MNNEIAIYGEGGKGGKGSHTPVEADDTLQSKQTIKLLFAISEGEIAGLDGVYLNQIPAYENGALTTNFNASIEYRTGTANQTVIKGFTATESPNTSFSSKANMVTDTDYLTSVSANVDAARLTFTIAQLRRILENGDMVGYSVEHSIGVRPITGSGAGTWVYTSVVKKGKASSAYSWDIRVNKPAGATVSWDIKVIRVTVNDSTSGAKYSSQTSWTACTDIIDVVNTYPNTALVSIVLKDAAQFGGQIPEIMFKPKGIKVALPTNYNPTTRVYTGNWNLALTTSYAYTDNPTWHLLHILKATKAHGGLGIPVTDIDLVSFYNLSRYCDQLLPHVVGGVSKNEPRYTLHNQFYARENVPTFLMYLLNICNANFTTNEFGQISLMYDHAGQAITKQVTNANVIEGKFNYSSNDLDSRVNLVNVTYNNAAYYGRTDTVTVLRDGNETGTYIASNDLVSRYGLQTSDIVLPGCSSEIQAIRKARWAIYTNSHLTNFVNFSVLLSGLTYSTGEIVRIYDNHNNQTIQSGLVVSSTISGNTTIITLDRLLVYPSGTCTFYALSTDGITSISAVIASHSTTSPSTITVNSIITPLVNNAFNIVGPSEAPVLVKVVKIDKSSNEYSINCVQHSESKYDYIDGTHSLVIPDWDFSNNPAYVSEPITNLTVTPNYSSNGVINRSKLQIHWNTPSTKHPSIYKLSWKRDNQEARLITNILTQGYDILEPEIGTYEIIVWAINPASSITSSAVSTIYAYRTTVSNSTLYPPKDIYVLGTSDVIYSTPDLAVSFNYDTLNDTIAVSDTLLNYVVEVWDKNTTPNLKATYTIPVSAGAGIDNNNFTAFTSTATNITKVTNSDNTVNFTKVAGGVTAWDSQGYSTIGNTGSCAVRFKFTTLAYRSAVGLSTTATTNASFSNLGYCFLNNATTGVVNLYESGIFKTSLSGCKVSDIFEIEYISNTSGIIRYKKNGQIVYTSTTTTGRTFYADSSFESVGSSVSNVLFGTYPAKTLRNGVFRFPYFTNIHVFGVPTREFDLKFFSRDTIGDLSNPAILTVNNPKPANTEFDFDVTSGIGTAYIRITPSSSASYDITGYKIWQCLTVTAGTYTKTDSNMVYDGPDTYITLKAIGSSDYTYWVAAYDSFGKDSLNISNSKTSTPLTNDAITWSKTGLVFSIDGTIANKLNWTLGTIIKGGVSTYNIGADSYAWTAGTGIVYVYFNPTASPTVLQTTTTLATAVAQGCYPIATYDGGDATHIKGGSGEAFISGSQLIAGTVGASQLIAGTAVITGTAQIGSAVIQDVLTSSTFSGTAPRAGWRLDKNGDITSYGTLNLLDSSGNVVLSSGNNPSFNYDYIGGSNRPDNKATRNVFKGNWKGTTTPVTTYSVGDIVLDIIGYGWSCVLAHNSVTATTAPPTYPVESNTYWTLYAVKGVDAVSVILSNDTHTLPATSDGTVGSYVGSGTTVTVYDGTRVVLYDGVGTTDGTWKVVATPTNITVGTLTDSGNFLTVGVQSGVAAGTDTASISYAITGKTFNGSAISFTAQQSFSKSKAGVSGTNGTSVYTGTVYQQTASAPAAPSGGTYNFNTGVLTAPAGWTITQPATSTTPTYAVDFVFSTITPATAVTATTWTNVRIEAVAGSAGANGVSIHVVDLYQQAASAPVLPTGTAYNFSNDILTGTLGSWSRSVPASSTTPTYKTSCTFTVTAPTVSQTLSTWSTAVVIAQNGSNGTNGTNGINGTNATYVIVTGEQAFKFLAGSATPTSSTLTLTAALFGGLTTYSWQYWNGTTWVSLAAINNPTTPTASTSATYALAYNNAVFTASSLRIRCLSGTDFDEITILKLYDGATGTPGTNGVSAISGYLTNETCTVSTASDGTGASFTSAGGTFKMFNGITDVTATSTFTTSAAVSGLTLTIGAATGIYSVAGTWTSDIASFTLTGVYSGTTITKVYKITKAKAGVAGGPGAAGDSVDIVFVRSATVPATPTASTGTPTAPITWYTSVTAANTAGGIVNPLYSSTGLKTASVGNYTWNAPVRIDGTAVAEVTVFVRSATVPATPTTGGTYTFSATPVVVAPTAPIAWSTSIPSGTNPVYTSRAVVSTSSSNTAAVAISGWSTPVISLQNGDDGAQGPTVQITTNRAATFVSNDDVLASSQTNLVFTATTSGITATSYVWTFYADSNTTPITSATMGVTLGGTPIGQTCTLTQTQFGSALVDIKSLKVVCVVNGNAAYTDHITVVRLDNSTAAPGATVGANFYNTYQLLNLSTYPAITTTAGLYDTTYVAGTGTLTSATGSLTITASLSNILTTATHDLTVGTSISYNCTATPITGLTNGVTYYVTAVTPTTFKLSITRANAILAVPVVLILGALTAGTHTINSIGSNFLFGGYSTTVGGASGAKLTFTRSTLVGSYMIGLTVGTSTSAHYSDIDYAIYLAGGDYYIRESGTDRGKFGTCVAGDRFAVLYDGGAVVSYYINGTNFYSSVLGTTITGNIIVDVSISTANTTINGIGFGAYTAPTLLTSNNLVGKIHPGNVSTYIANAAIAAAQIGSINLVGNFNVASSTTGERMTMDSQAIKVYDDANILRVRIGNLA